MCPKTRTPLVTLKYIYRLLILQPYLFLYLEATFRVKTESDIQVNLFAML